MSKRDDIRTKIFGGSRRRSTLVNFAGAEIEVKQPSIGEMISRSFDPENKKDSIFGLLLNCCFVPGTNEKVFDSGDKETFLKLPMNEEYIKLQNAVLDLTALDPEQAEGNSPTA